MPRNRFLDGDLMSFRNETGDLQNQFWITILSGKTAVLARVLVQLRTRVRGERLPVNILVKIIEILRSFEDFGDFISIFMFM